MARVRYKNTIYIHARTDTTIMEYICTHTHIHNRMIATRQARVMTSGRTTGGVHELEACWARLKQRYPPEIFREH